MFNENLEKNEENVKSSDKELGGSRLWLEFINRSMRSGKKGVAEKNILQMKRKLKGNDALLEKAVENVSNDFEIKSQKRGGTRIMIPYPVESQEKKQSKAIRLLIKCARARKNKRNSRRISDKLSLEIIDASNQEGQAFERAKQIRKMVMKNKDYMFLLRRRKLQKTTNQRT